MSCFFFYFKPIGLYSGGLLHGLMFTLVTGVGLYEDGLILGWAYPWQFTVTNLDNKQALFFLFNYFCFLNTYIKKKKMLILS